LKIGFKEMNKIKLIFFFALVHLSLQFNVFANLEEDGVYETDFKTDVFQDSGDESIKWSMSRPAKNLNLIKIENNQLTLNYNEKNWVYAYFDVSLSIKDIRSIIQGTIDVKGTAPAKIMIYSLKEDGKTDGPLALTNDKKKCHFYV
jgi:hypothetical protein